MSNIHTDLSTVQISVAPNTATAGTSFGVTDAHAALLPNVYPWWGLVRAVNTKPTRANSEIIKVTAGSSSGGTTTYTIVRAQGIPVTTARSIIVGDDISEVHTAQKQIDTEFLEYEGKKYKILNPYENTKSLHLKGQIHCHTTNSDGVDTPTALVTAYEAAGYDFITITDHDYLTPNPEVAGITWIGVGIEETIARHLVALDVTTQSTSNNVQEVMNFHSANSSMVGIAHPSVPGYYDIDYVEFGQYYGFNFVDVSSWDRTYDTQVDYALSNGKHLFLTSVDDCHDVSDAAHFNKNWIVVHTDTNSKVAILQSMRDGNFYASTGNDISISLNGKIITATSNASSNFTFYGKDGRILKTESAVTTSSYTILGNEMYVRVKSTLVADSTNAWSQPIFVDLLTDDNELLAKTNKSLIMSSIGRQALINGNFDVWQRGTSYNSGYTDGLGVFLADRWYDSTDDGGGTRPTITRSKQILTSGDISNAFYYTRLAVDGAGTSLGGNSYHVYIQKIEHGTRLLCGNGKKVTVSFWARSDISNKRICPTLRQNYGTGGSPSSSEVIQGTPITLTSTWTKYTKTFTTNTLSNKTFGTDNNDYLGLFIYNQWGETWGNTYVQTSVSAETYVGAGNIDIAQVQLCAGDVALPFMPKSFEEESKACKRYYQKYGEGVSSVAIAMGHGITTSRIDFAFVFPVEMRIAPTCTYSSLTANDSGAAETLSALNAGSIYDKRSCNLQFDCNSTCVADRLYKLQTSGTSGYIDFSAEL